MTDEQGVANSVFRHGPVGPSGLQDFLERLDVTMLNPVQFAPAQNTFKMEANGIWNAVLIPGTNSIRCTIV